MFKFLTATAAVTAFALAGCSAETSGPGGGSADSGNKRIIILTNGDDPFWDPCEAGAMAAADDLNAAEKGYDVVFERGNFTVERQVEMLRGYRLAGDVAAVGVSVFDGDAKAIADELRDLREADIEVITIDGDVDRELYRDVRTAYLGTENIKAGRELGRVAAAIQPDGGKAVTFVGTKSAANAVARIDGFVEGAGDKFDHLETLADDSDPAKARDRVRDALQRHEDLDTLVGIWAYNAPAAVDMAEEMDALDRVNIYSVDAAELTIRAMEEGKVKAMVVQNPYDMGKLGVEMLLALVTDDEATVEKLYPKLGEPDGDLMSTGLKIVVPDDSTLTKETYETMAEFFRLSKFQAWLKERGLKNS